MTPQAMRAPPTSLLGQIGMIIATRMDHQ